MKSASQDGILAVCADIPRPMRVMKVCTSGTKGVGFGIVRGGGFNLCSDRRCVHVALRRVVGRLRSASGRLSAMVAVSLSVIMSME